MNLSMHCVIERMLRLAGVMEQVKLNSGYELDGDSLTYRLFDYYLGDIVNLINDSQRMLRVSTETDRQAKILDMAQTSQSLVNHRDQLEDKFVQLRRVMGNQPELAGIKERHILVIEAINRQISTGAYDYPYSENRLASELVSRRMVDFFSHASGIAIARVRARLLWVEVEFIVEAIATLAIAVLGIYLMVHQYRTVLRPLRQIVGQIESLSQNSLPELPQPDERRDEVGILVNSSHRIKTLIEERKRLIEGRIRGNKTST